jgi:aminopeptidase-like protein
VKFKKKDTLFRDSYPMYNWCKDLFPICRSITGNGIKKTLLYFEKINPVLKRLKFKSGSKVFDWTVPHEWNIEDAYIKDCFGNKHADFKKNNLHVVNFSESVSKKINKKKLLKKIYTVKENKAAIPYVTSYYKKQWGFCMSENQKKKLPNGNFNVVIKSKFKKGFLDLDHAIIKGKNKKEIFFSSYVCHPSMANNELSGPVVLNALLKYINDNYKKTNLTYRFVLIPETIGSISYLSKFKNIMKKNILMGFNLSCLGDAKAYSIIKGPNENCLSFQALHSLLKNKKNLKIFDFLERGSDERQYCAPGIDLPISGFCRSKYNNYPEYHTHLDDLKVISQKNLEDSLKILIDLVDCCELALFPKAKILCEPMLSKRKLYPSISKFDTNNPLPKMLNLRKNLLAYSNGKRNIFEISKILNINILDIFKEYKILKKNKLII